MNCTEARDANLTSAAAELSRHFSGSIFFRENRSHYPGRHAGGLSGSAVHKHAAIVIGA